MREATWRRSLQKVERREEMATSMSSRESKREFVGNAEDVHGLVSSGTMAGGNFYGLLGYVEHASRGGGDSDMGGWRNWGVCPGLWGGVVRGRRRPCFVGIFGVNASGGAGARENGGGGEKALPFEMSHHVRRYRRTAASVIESAIILDAPVSAGKRILTTSFGPNFSIESCTPAKSG
jgi:hypothetical protein